MINGHSYIEELCSFLAGRRVCIVGGNQKWRTTLLKLFPKCVEATNDNFPADRVKNADLVIINTNLISHGVTRKATRIAFSNDIEVVYTSRNNVECMAGDLIRWAAVAR